MIIKKIVAALLLLVLVWSPVAMPAETVLSGVEMVLKKSAGTTHLKQYTLILASYEKMPAGTELKKLSRLDSNWVYFTKVNVKNRVYYRLVVGNYSTLKQARSVLAGFRKQFSGAWIHKRDTSEIKLLAVKVPMLTRPSVTRPGSKTLPVKPAQKATSSVTNSDMKKEQALTRDGRQSRNVFAEKLLSQSRQLLLDRKYAQLVKVSNKVIEVGNAEQKQRGMQFAGLARERQRKFAQAIAIYKRFLEQYPDSSLARKIQSRLNTLKTMNLEPRTRMARRSKQRSDDGWSLTGSFSQYYRKNFNDTTENGNEVINDSLLTDISLYARNRTQSSTTIIRFDGGLVSDFLDDSNDSNLSRASLRYTSHDADYEVIAGRQSRTAKGVLGRFDGVVYSGLSHENWDYSLYAGFPVQSSSDGFKSARRFIGSNLSLQPAEKMELDLYLLFQQNEGLTDRQAVGSQLQYRSDKGFLFTIFDYDFFYKEINDLTAITNYRFSSVLTLNLTLNYRNSPTLTSLNAIQGQGVTTFEELTRLYPEDEIYQLAADRTSKSKNLFLNVSYQIDQAHQLDTSIAVSQVEETVASGGVEAAPASEDFNLSSSYTINGYFLPDDFTTFGLRYSDTTSSHSLSFRLRARFKGSEGWRYDPRLQLDYRESKTSGVQQWIVRPKFKVKYKPNKKTSLEASVGIDYSNFDLPELDDQLTTNFLIGYLYRI